MQLDNEIKNIAMLDKKMQNLKSIQKIIKNIKNGRYHRRKKGIC